MTIWRTATMTGGLLVVAACTVVPPFRFEAESARLKREAAQSFPIGSEAARFEAWFVAKAGSGLSLAPQKDRSVSAEPLCEQRLAVLHRQEGCMNELSANYCVDPRGNLTALVWNEGGYS